MLSIHAITQKVLPEKARRPRAHCTQRQRRLNLSLAKIGMDRLEMARYAIAASLLYATAVTLQCPCDPLMGCHLPHFYIATLATSPGLSSRPVACASALTFSIVPEVNMMLIGTVSFTGPTSGRVGLGGWV